MLKNLLQPLLHSSFVLTRPLTIGVRGICYAEDINSVLLVRHTYSEGWQLPGGGVEPGESMFATLQRELSDEVGIECRSAEMLDAYHNYTISRRDHVIIYLVEDWREIQVHERPKLEIAQIAWFQLIALPSELSPCSDFALKTYERKMRCIASSPLRDETTL